MSAIALLSVGVLASIGSAWVPWARARAVPRPDRFQTAIDASANGWIGIFLAGLLALAAAALATVLAAGRAQPVLRVVGSCVGGCLVALAVTVPLTRAREAVRHSPSAPDSTVGVRPDVGLWLALAAVASYLVVLWVQPGRPQPTPAPRWHLGLPVLVAGLAMLSIAPRFPWWRTVYIDQVQTVAGAMGARFVFPLWFVPVGLTVMSLATVGQAQRIARLLNVVLGCMVLLSCGGITGLYWAFSAGDAIAKERGMIGTSPGTGLVLALVSLALITLGGTIGWQRPRMGPPIEQNGAPN